MTQDRPSLDQVVRKVNDISTLPHVAMQIMEVANDPKSDAASIKDVMESDPPLSARVLKVVNSSAYGLSTRVTSLQRAIAMLGVKQVRNIALTASVSELFKSQTEIGGYKRSDLWRHMVSVGVGARFIAMRRSLPDFEEAFLGGLLHDIGIILEDQYVHEQFKTAVLDVGNHASFVESEMKHIGFNHAMLGAEVSANWKFPSLAIAAVKHHHQPTRYKGDDRMLLHAIDMANLICTLKGITSIGEKKLPMCPETISMLQLTKKDIAVIATDLDEEIKKFSDLIRL